MCFAVEGAVSKIFHRSYRLNGRSFINSKKGGGKIGQN